MVLFSIDLKCRVDRTFERAYNAVSRSVILLDYTEARLKT